MKTLSLFLVVVFATALTPASGDDMYEITISNRAKSSLTSIVWATHGRQASMFRRGEKASLGVAEMAEDGVAGILKREMRAQEKGPRGVHSVGESFGPGAKGSVTFRVRADSRRAFLSWATMAVCSNDTFAGQAAFRLPRQYGHTKKRL
ncbi:MAG: spondin domain-containing protein, partial [Verrucomicrobiota bacterium]